MPAPTGEETDDGRDCRLRSRVPLAPPARDDARAPAGIPLVVPHRAIVLALAVGSILSTVDVDPSSSPWKHLVFQGTVDDARNLLIGIASTMVTVIALVLGLTVVALQLASTQFSPRLLRNFLRDRVNQVVLSVFVATFTYSSAGLYTVGIAAGGRTSSFPRLAVTGALVLLFASMVMLIFFVHHLAHSIQIDEIMRRVEHSTLQVIAHSLPTGDGPGAGVPPPPDHAWPVPADRSGYVQTLHPEVLLPLAVEVGLAASVVPMVGEHVVEGAPILYVWSLDGGQPRVPPEVVAELTRDAIRLGFERTLEQDVALGSTAAGRHRVQGALPGDQRPLYRRPGAGPPVGDLVRAGATATRRSDAARARRHRAREGAGSRSPLLRRPRLRSDPSLRGRGAAGDGGSAPRAQQHRSVVPRRRGPCRRRQPGRAGAPRRRA